MSLNETVSALRVKIGFFGKRNAGKSTLVNAIAGQEVSLVSEIKGTTTDPVKKSMELLPLGPVVLVDTPGLDDEGALGELRIKKTRELLQNTDMAILVADPGDEDMTQEEELLGFFYEKKIPCLLVYNVKQQVSGETGKEKLKDLLVTYKIPSVEVNGLSGDGIEALKHKIGEIGHGLEKDPGLIREFIQPGDIVVLITPIDESAPKGRLILPQQMVVRDVLDGHGICVTVQPEELEEILGLIPGKPRMVITDSQIFKSVAEVVPRDVHLTSFSIIMARHKGSLAGALEAARVLSTLRDGDKLLISEGCTHHRQCQDIGTVKIPAMLKKFTGKELDISFSAGGTFPEDLKEYKVVIHCGACTLTEKEMQRRRQLCEEAGVPMTNYGIAIACMNGILDRSIELFGKNPLKM